MLQAASNFLQTAANAHKAVFGKLESTFVHSGCVGKLGQVWTRNTLNMNPLREKHQTHFGIRLKDFLSKFQCSGYVGQHAGQDSNLLCLSVGTYRGNL